ncbi:MAG: anti-sigma factor domain-containing protein [Erysipelotrichaceae bacterium]|jgi:hypothetical protein
MKKYIVMECHLSYAVVLDEDGRFLKVANRHYQVGQTVTDVIEMQIPQSIPKQKKTKSKRWFYSLAAMAAVIVMMVTIVFQFSQMTYASIYMSINPEVRIDVNRNDVVVNLQGVNMDGNDLIKDYDYKKKDLELVMDELLERAIEKGYLYDGSKITLTFDADNNEWIVSRSDALSTQINNYLSEKITITIEIKVKNSNDQIIIPINPDDSDYDDSDYGDSDYVDSDYGNTDYDDSDYQSPDYDDSDYNSPDYDDSDYQSPDYDDSDYSSDSGITDYGY